MGNTQDKLLNDPEIQKIKPKCSPSLPPLLTSLFQSPLLKCTCSDFSSKTLPVVHSSFHSSESFIARNDEFIDKETFLQFFPLTVFLDLSFEFLVILQGLWGEKLFEKFDYKHTGYINFYGFLQGIACCCKSAEDDKVHLLFSLYDMDQDGYIKKKEMITMVSGLFSSSLSLYCSSTTTPRTISSSSLKKSLQITVKNSNKSVKPDALA